MPVLSQVAGEGPRDIPDPTPDHCDSTMAGQPWTGELNGMKEMELFSERDWHRARQWRNIEHRSQAPEGGR